MNLDELRSIQSKERQTDSLQPLRASFYEEVAEYIQRLRTERERVADEQGFDAPEFRRLSDEIDAAEDTVESLYERRVGKVVKAASFAAAGMPAEDEGLTAEEQDLFDTLVDDITANRERVLAVLDGEPDEATAEDAPAAPPTEPDPEPTPDATARPDAAPDEGGGVDAADLMGGGEETSDPPTPDERGADAEPAGASTEAPTRDAATEDAGAATADEPAASRATGDATDDAPTGAERAAGEPSGPAPEESPGDGPPEPSADGGAAAAAETVERTTVRITRDVGEILGVDERAYDLGEDDVVTLPSANAAPLVERDAAERLE